MSGHSPAIVSNQSGVHPRLADVVTRHLRHPFKKPVAAHTQAAYAQLKRVWNPAQALVLDAGCGTGESTAALARDLPQAFVLGVDQSAARLAKAPLLPANALLLRADVTDLWRLMAADSITVARHTWFYPNPWPKAEHLQRRWYAHPAFAAAIELGGTLEIRSNWLILMQEAQIALVLATRQTATIESLASSPQVALSLHERKYADSGHALYRLQICIR